jgi:hypothetical protein
MPTLEEMRVATADIRAGACCANCRVAFEGQHGHEVLCRYCHRTLDDDARRGLPRATIREI